MSFFGSILASFVFVFVQVAHAESLSVLYHEEIFRLEKEARTRGADYLTTTVQKRNLETLAQLRSTKGNRFPRRTEFVSRELADSIYWAVADHPVASLDHYAKYDPKDSGIGFCFGRAMTVHLESLYQGVSRDSIRKLWALGDLASGTTLWRYHVTSVVKGPRGTWLAIDPIMGEVMTVTQWYQRMKAEFDSNGKMRIYVTEAEQFGPDTNKYHNSDLQDPYYNKYFLDLMKYYRALYRKQ